MHFSWPLPGAPAERRLPPGLRFRDFSSTERWEAGLFPQGAQTLTCTLCFVKKDLFSLCVENMSNLFKIIKDEACLPPALLLVEMVGFQVLSVRTPTAFIMDNLFWVGSEEQLTGFKDMPAYAQRGTCARHGRIHGYLCPSPLLMNR